MILYLMEYISTVIFNGIYINNHLLFLSYLRIFIISCMLLEYDSGTFEYLVKIVISYPYHFLLNFKYFTYKLNFLL